MKRLISFILVVTLCIVSSVFPVAARTVDYKDRAVSFLAGMDILRGDENGNYLLDKSVNRAEFTAFVIRILGMENLNVSGGQTFIDVPDDHWAKNVIATGSSLNLIQGVGGGYFEPDRTVTLDEAVKILVCALGYQVAAEEQGGYPTGYAQIGMKLNLYKNLSSSAGVLDRGNTCVLLYNALGAKVYDDFLGTTGKTMMEENLGLTTIRGTITATPSYQADVSLDTDEIMLDGVVYECKDTYADNYIGCSVVCYVREESKGYVIYYIQSDDDTRSVTVSAEDISEETTLSKFHYYTSNDVKKLNLDDELTVFYNGEKLPQGEITEATLKPVTGSVTLRDGNGNNRYDTIIIEVYTDYVVQYVADDIVYGKFGSRLDLSDSENTTILKDGEEITLENIQNGDVLSVMQSRDGVRTRILVSDSYREGYVKAINRSGSEDVYVLADKTTGDDVEFRLGRAYKNALASSHHDAVRLTIGSEKNIRIYFNDFGLVADVIVQSSSEEYTYGFLMQTRTTSGGFNDSIQFRMLTLNNRFEIFKSREDGKILFGRKVGSEYVVSKEDADDVARSLTSKRVVKYKLDSDGNIAEIYKYDPVQSSDHFSVGPEDGTLLSYRDGVFDNRYYIDQNTAVFSTSPYEKIYAAGKYTQFLRNDVTKYCTFYDVEGSYAKVLLMNAPYATLYNDDKETGYEVILDYVNSPLFYIDSISQIIAEDGEAYMQLSGFQDGEPRELLVSNNIKPNSEPVSNLKPGIVIQYEGNGYALERALTSDEIPQMLLFKTVYDFTEPTSPDIFWEYAKVKSSRSMITTMWGNVTNVNGEYCTLDVGDESYTARVHEHTMVLRYDSVKNRFEQVSADMINTSQNVFIRQRYQNTREVVIY